MQCTQSDFKSWLWVLTLAFLLMTGPEAAKAEGPPQDVAPNEMQSGSLLLRMANGYSVATLLNTDVDMNISGLVARVSVRQEFRNTSQDWVEGIYVFPLPDKAAVDRMRLHIGERFIEGEIQEKEHAKKTYEQAKKAGKKASLVEQQRANLFTTSVANIAPGELVVIEIEYLEDIRYEAGQFSIRFPMTLTPRYIPGSAMPDRTGSGWSPDTDQVRDASTITPPQVTAAKAHQLSLTAKVNAGMPLQIIASRYHPVSVGEDSGQYTVSMRSGTVAMDHDFELLWRPEPSVAPRAMSFVETVDGKPKATDRFNVIEFNSVTNALYTQSQPVTVLSMTEASHFVQRLQANGGTEMRPALSMALESPASEEHLRQIVFITDGSVGYEDELSVHGRHWVSTQ